jgi:hypothetical protein
MGKHLLNEVLSIGSDIAAAVTGQPWLAVAGNSLGGGIEHGWKGALTEGGTAFLGNEVFGPGLSKALGSTGIDPQIAKMMGSFGGNFASSQLEPTLAKAVGLTPPTPSPTGHPATTPGPSMPQGGAHGIPSIPAGLGISGATTPNIAPWRKPDQPQGLG